jgi:hypothetical protein
MEIFHFAEAQRYRIIGFPFFSQSYLAIVVFHNKKNRLLFSVIPGLKDNILLALLCAAASSGKQKSRRISGGLI